jgi:hypothetical protein
MARIIFLIFSQEIPGLSPGFRWVSGFDVPCNQLNRLRKQALPRQNQVLRSTLGPPAKDEISLSDRSALHKK